MQQSARFRGFARGQTAVPPGGLLFRRTGASGRSRSIVRGLSGAVHRKLLLSVLPGRIRRLLLTQRRTRLGLGDVGNGLAAGNSGNN